ncbi:FAD/NAD(P)-binding protein [Streptomyces sp. TS71-3]|uniref:FAD/NAD(P)-binding protein n=1 Tax=Streptomyces sp. TS71-3 TaxID=2733862 RepID=UPI001B06550D|nr:FAD/NAD(P)-binding protein [Streptomyces sp. TS71-3]GHJ41315.1 hypothetical protein Sm713_69240 [Streptomyces sp. TS71-3]
MTPTVPRKSVAVVGAGAAGALVAVRLCEAAVRRGVPLELFLIDPAPEAGRGTAYATRDPRHLLNVPAGKMSCHPDDPGHFVRWLCRHGEPTIRAADFVSRYRYGAYLADTLGHAIIAAHGVVRVRRLKARVTDCRWSHGPAGHARLELSDGKAVDADGVVLATGPAHSSPAGLPSALRTSDRFVADPWAPGALDAAAGERCREDLLLIGTGLTAVDVALRLNRPGRTVHAVSRNGRLPQAHALSPLPATPPTEPLLGLPLPRLRTEVRRHIGRVLRTQGDWRPGLDGLRPVTAELWASLSVEERADFIRHDGSLWNVHRHRMPPATAETVARLRRARRLQTAPGGITSARQLPDGLLSVGLGDGHELRVSRVVDCTGPGLVPADTSDPLWRNLLHRGDAVPGPLGIGVTTENGRLRDRDGRTARALWTLGAPRRGELWETTAIPEIRVQAAAVAEALLALPAASSRRCRSFRTTTG